MNKKINFLIVIILTSILFISACSSSSDKKDKTRGGEKGKDIPSLSVNGIVITPQTLDNNIDIIGTILPNEKVELRSEVAGRIVSLPLKEDAHVKKGQVLVKIFDQELKAQLQKIKLQQELLNLQEQRSKKLLEIGGISQQEYDIIHNQASSMRSDADLIQAQIERTEIRAPFDGVVGLRYVSEGELVSSATLIGTLQQIDPVKIEFDIPEKYGVYVKKGSTITFTVTGSDNLYKGIVYAIEPMIELATRTFKVRARTNNNDYALRPGSFIKIELLLEKEKNAILVPTESVVPSIAGQKIFLYNHGIALSRKVSTGIRNERMIQIVEGLEKNDTVITSGIMQLKDSAHVKINVIR